MSRVGSRPIKIEEGATVEAGKTKITVKGTHGELSLDLPKNISVTVDGDKLLVSADKKDKDTESLYGLTARLINNMIKGVTESFKRELEFNGTGYRAAVNGKELVLNMGYSHEIRMEIPEGLEVSVVKNVITVKGSKKEEVGQFAAKIRAVRPPEVYKGKGIKYRGEYIRRKAGKTAASK